MAGVRVRFCEEVQRGDWKGGEAVEAKEEQH